MSLTRSRRRTPGPARNVLDFRPNADAVERRDGKTFVVDTEGLYAPLEVQSDAMPADFVERVRALGPERAAKMFEAIRTTPFLSVEGKRERLTALLAAGVVTISFTVETEHPRTQLLRRLMDKHDIERFIMPNSKKPTEDNPIVAYAEEQTAERIAKFLERVADDKDNVVLAAAAQWIRNGEWREVE